MYSVIIGIQIIGIITLAIEIVYLFTRNTSRLQLTLLVMSICVFINFTGETAEILSTDPNTALMAVRLSYLGKPFIVFTCFLFFKEYCRAHIKKWILGALFAIQATVSILAFTCPYHTIYYSSIGWTELGIFPHLVLGKSPLYWLYSALIGVYFVMYAVLIIRQLRRSTTDEQRRQALSLFAIIAIMGLSLFVYLTGVTAGYDVTLLGYAISLILLVHAILRYNLFETMTLARERAMQDSDDGLVVLDQRKDIIYVNPVAGNVLGIPAFSTEAENETQTPFRRDEDSNELISKLERFSQDTKPFPVADSFYRANSRELRKDGTFYGHIYEFKNVTESYTYSTRLEHDVAEKTQEIRKMQREITVAFANMVEARDDITGAHIKNTSNYVRILTRSLQNMIATRCDNDPERVAATWGSDYAKVLDPTFLETIVDVAPLHDLGKIAVPDAILRKPGRLDDDEFEIMKTHAAKGAKIIEQTLSGIESPEYVAMAKDLAGGHHERWDGTGYPTGLAGTAIPLSARIMAIADVYDALLSKRSYKEAYSKEKSRDIIVEGAGSHFDPVLVEAFELALFEMEAV